MSFGLLNSLILLGLAGVAIPPLIHLLNRRRYQTVDWGAMQFLQVSETTRRRLLLEELLLMLLRMGLIAVMVLALAAPYVTGGLLTAAGARPNRDVVLVFDLSASMEGGAAERTPYEAAREWARTYLHGLSAGDSVTVLLARQQVVPLVGEPTHDLERVRRALDQLPTPRGGCNWPDAIQTAFKILSTSTRPQRDVILLGDGQRYGWADDAARLRWELLADGWRARPSLAPNVWYVNFAPGRTGSEPNWSLAPLRVSRAVASAGQEIKVSTTLRLHGQATYQPPYRLRLEIDGGRERRELDFPANARLEKGQVPLHFSHRFTTPGSHLLSVVVEPDPPAGRRPPGYVVKDQLPGDNRQDLAVEVVPALPVLVVDGDTRAAARQRGADFLRNALAPPLDRTPVALVKVVSARDFAAEQLATDLDAAKPGSKPRVLVLANVARLQPEQQSAVDRFLAEGGGVLVTLGSRVDPAFYNEHLYRGGAGWLPARLDETAGSEAAEDRAASPLPSSFASHPALALFRGAQGTGLADVRFPRWWKVTTPGKNPPGRPIALLSTADPWLVERRYQRGTVLLCAVPLDASWRTNLTATEAYVPLVHELIYYLAGTRGLEHNLQPGQPLHYRPDRGDLPANVVVQPPEGPPRPFPVARWPLVYDDTREPGVYRVTAAGGPPTFYCVRPDPRESDLTPCTDEDRAAVAQLLPVKYVGADDRPDAVASDTAAKRELWWWFMLGVVALLCGEVWLTRRIARHS